MRHQISYKVLHGEDGDALTSQVIKYLEEYSYSPMVDEYWETLGPPFYAHAGVAQAMIKLQEVK